MLIIEAANTNVIIFGLTQPGLKLMIYCTRDKHANQYITLVVKILGEMDRYTHYDNISLMS